MKRTLTGAAAMRREDRLQQREDRLSDRVLDLQAQIASLTEENERLRALLKRWSNYDDLDRIMGGVEAYEKLSADTGNALQPKEGE